MNLQIDALPESQKDPSLTSYRVNLYIDGCCYSLLASGNTISHLKDNGLIKQVTGMKHNDIGELVSYEYPNKIDSAGVQYTSPVFEIKNK